MEVAKGGIMKKHRSLNPVYLLCCIFIPWRYINTYFAFDDSVLYLSGYYAQKKGGRFRKQLYVIELNTLDSFGFTKEYGRSTIEPIIAGAVGVYMSQEVVFLLSEDTIIPWNVRPFTRRQIKKCAENIRLKCGVNPKPKLSKEIRFDT